MAEALILWQYTSALFTAKRNLASRLLLLIGSYLGLFVVILSGIGWLNGLLYFIVNLIFIFTQYRTRWYTALFHSAILTAIMCMCELIMYSIVKYSAPHFTVNSKDYLHLIIFAVFNKLLFFTIIYILIFLLSKQNQMQQQSDKSVFLLLLIPLTSIWVMHTFLTIEESCTLTSDLEHMIAVSAIFLLTMNLLIFGINQYNQYKNREFTQMQLLLQKESASAQYYEMLRQQNETQRILIHDIKKHLLSINMLNEESQNEKISAYIHQLILSSDLKESVRLCDHPLLNSILSRYTRQCEEHHICFHCDIRSGTVDFITDYDLTTLFCNLLDNAVEAACIVPDSFIDITVAKREKTPFIVITIVNSCINNFLLQQDTRLTTTKSDTTAHGFGLKSIHRAIEKYQGNLKMYYNEETSTFHSIITLKQLSLK